MTFFCVADGGKWECSGMEAAAAAILLKFMNLLQVTFHCCYMAWLVTGGVNGKGDDLYTLELQTD